MAYNACRVLSCLQKQSSRLLNIRFREQILVTQVRGRKRWQRAVFRNLYWRRIEQGPEPERPRSAWINWNYDAEIFALGQRLKEDFSEATLKRALTDSSYIEKEKLLRKDLEMGDAVDLEDNVALIQKGEEFASDYVKAFLRHSFPALPEEGICSVSDYLLSDEMLAEIGSNIGIKDLILCAVGRDRWVNWQCINAQYVSTMYSSVFVTELNTYLQLYRFISFATEAAVSKY